MHKPVLQEHPSGCAVSCVAAITQKPYRVALKLFKNIRYARFRGYYCKEIIAALRRAGKKYDFVYAKPSKKKWLMIPNTIVYIQKSKDHEMGHYLVRTENGLWMDPWINYPAINPAKAGFRKSLHGKAQWIIHPLDRTTRRDETNSRVGE